MLYAGEERRPAQEGSFRSRTVAVLLTERELKVVVPNDLLKPAVNVLDFTIFFQKKYAHFLRFCWLLISMVDEGLLRAELGPFLLDAL